MSFTRAILPDTNQIIDIPKLLFIVGKGGVGRTSICSALAASLAAEGKSVLVVQWALKDSISPIYSLPDCYHKETLLPDGFSVMNYSPKEAIREYFVEHLKMKLLYSVVIENKHVQKLIQAGPGVQELFFLGRLFWLVELAKQERGFCYDHIIVDLPAMGHGVALFQIAQAVASLGMTGPLAHECERVANLLADCSKTGVFFVTLPEELPVEETLEFVPKLTKQLNRPPLLIVINQSINTSLFLNINDLLDSQWYLDIKNKLTTQEAKNDFELMATSLIKRNKFENIIRSWAKDIPVFSLPDANLLGSSVTSYNVVKNSTRLFQSLLRRGVTHG